MTAHFKEKLNLFNILKDDPEIKKYMGQLKTAANTQHDETDEEKISIYEEDDLQIDDADPDPAMDDDHKEEERRGEKEKTPTREKSPEPSPPHREVRDARDVITAKRINSTDDDDFYHKDCRPNYMNSPASFHNPHEVGNPEENNIQKYTEPTDHTIHLLREVLDRRYPGLTQFLHDFRHDDGCSNFQCQERFWPSDVVCGFYSTHGACNFNWTHDDKKNDHRWIHICNNCWRTIRMISFHRASCSTCPINRALVAFREDMERAWSHY